MNKKFDPFFDVLPVSQKQLWPTLRSLSELGFVLYGGTAVALRLGHRYSIDFDFFSEKPLKRAEIKSSFDWVAHSTVLQESYDTWVMLVPVKGAEQVKVSFFGEISFGRVGEPQYTTDGVLQVASLDDLMATKLKVILQRAEVKYYFDIAAMIKAGVRLDYGLSTARQLFGSNFQPSESLKALTYFDDGDLATLSLTERQILIESARNVADLPQVSLRSTSLASL